MLIEINVPDDKIEDLIKVEVRREMREAGLLRFVRNEAQNSFNKWAAPRTSLVSRVKSLEQSVAFLKKELKEVKG